MSARVYEPTPRRLADARDAGDLAHSPELSLSVVLLATWLAVTTTTPALGEALSALSQALFAAVRELPSGAALVSVVAPPLLRVATAVVPLLVAPAIAWLAVSLVQTGFVIAGRRSGTWRADSVMSSRLHDASWSTVKLVVTALVLAIALRDALPGLLDTWKSDPSELGPRLASTLSALLVRAALALLFVGVVDYVYQTARRMRRLRMTRAERDDEQRATEGDPRLLAERRRRARDLALQTGLLELSRATLVVHDGSRAVALRFVPSEHPSPRVWIKADAANAQQLRQAAAERGLPIHVDASLTAALLRLETAEPVSAPMQARLARPGAVGPARS